MPAQLATRLDRVPLILERLDLVDYLESTGVEFRRDGSQLKALCPLHQERTPSFTVKPTEGVWYCHGCGRGGGLIDYVTTRDGCSKAEAIELLARLAGVDGDAPLLPVARPAQRPRERRDDGPPPPGPDELDELVSACQDALWSTNKPGPALAVEYLLERGYTVDELERYRVGYAGDPPAPFRHLQNRIVLPCLPHGLEARLVPAVLERWPGAVAKPDAKYLTTGPKRAHGLEHADPPTVVLVEGIVDAHALWRAEVEAVALRGKRLQAEDATELARRGVTDAYVALDGDTAPQDHAALAAVLAGAGIRAQPTAGLDDGRDPGDLLRHDTDQLYAAVYGELLTEPRDVPAATVELPLW